MEKELAALADELTQAREHEAEVRARLKEAVIRAHGQGMPAAQIITATGLARRTVYLWIET